LKWNSSVAESTKELDAVGKEFNLFFDIYVHKMYSPVLGVKLQGKVTFCINYLLEKPIHRLCTQFMVVILAYPARHITRYDRLHSSI
jgi:hypothetical protein